MNTYLNPDAIKNSTIPADKLSDTFTNDLTDRIEAKQDVISDIEEIRTNAANYKGTVTRITVDNVSKSPSNGNVNLGYVNKQFIRISGTSITLAPNLYFRNMDTSLPSLTITLVTNNLNTAILNEYFIEFTTSSSGTTISLPSDIKWMNGVTPTFEPSTTYQISIVNNLGTWVKFK